MAVWDPDGHLSTSQKPLYNWAQFVTTGGLCSKEARIWSSTDVIVFLLPQFGTQDKIHLAELIIPDNLHNSKHLLDTKSTFSVSFSLSLWCSDQLPYHERSSSSAIARCNQQETYRDTIISWSIRRALKTTSWENIPTEISELLEDRVQPYPSLYLPTGHILVDFTMVLL